jgi:hypothetical protein
MTQTATNGDRLQACRARRTPTKPKKPGDLRLHRLGRGGGIRTPDP